MIEKLGYRLTDRDYLILKYTAEMDFVGYDAFHRLFFSHCKNEYTTYKILNRLVKAGLLVKMVTEAGRRYFILTQEGLNTVQFKFSQSFFLDLPKGISYKHKTHSLNLSLYRLHFEKLYTINKWKSDRFLAHDSGLSNRHSRSIPDAIFSTSSDSFVVEYERVLKSKPRILEKITNLNSKINMEGATHGFILCENKKIKKAYQDSIFFKNITLLLTSSLIY